MNSSILPQVLITTKPMALQISKHILKQEDPFLALMAYHATPIPAAGKTPSELIMGRQIRTTVPTMAKVLAPKLPNHAMVKKADAKAKRGYKEWYKRTAAAAATRGLGEN